jgi:hypothetical protein
MPFTIFQHSTAAHASEVNDNFYHIGQGDVLPRDGNSLTVIDSTYDLGSSTFKWNNIYANKTYLYGNMYDAMNLISEVTLTVTSSVIDITGLNGETDEIYEIIFNGVGYATGTAYMFPNADSQTNNYGYQYFMAISTAIVAARSMSNLGIYVGRYLYETITTKFSKSYLRIYSNNNIKLILNTEARQIDNSYIGNMVKWGFIWNNSATLTSLKFTGYFNPGTNVQIWAKR